MKLILQFLFLIFFISIASANVSIISFGAAWKYLDDGSNQGTTWMSTGFNDVSWNTANAHLGYGDGDETSVLNAGCLPVASCTPKFITTYFRKNITIASTATFSDYTLNVKRDDGIVVYIDGIEIYRNNMPAGAIGYTTLASAACTDDGNAIQSTTLSLTQIPAGSHTIAVEIHQSANNSSDISFDLELVANELSVVKYGDVWKYLDNGTDQGTTWRATTFNDNTWLSGNAQLGYGDGDESTIISYGGNAVNKYICTYFRKNITIGNTALISDYTLNMTVDDGIIVYIDGTEVYRNNMPVTVNYLTLASSAYENNALSTTLSLAQLPTGNHTIAVEIHQTAVNSSDLSFNLELIANLANAVAVTRGPYLNMATQNSVHIRWRTNNASNSIVNYGTVDGSLTSTVTDATNTTEHDITVAGLAPDTKYYYSIGNTIPSIQTLKTGTPYYFSTLPVKGVERICRIWAVGDCGNNSTNQINVRNWYMKYMGKKHTDIMLLLGDNAYDNGTDAEFQSKFFPQYQDSILRNVVLWPAPGNHDYANNASRQNDHIIPYYDMFTLPTNGESGGVPSGTEAYYAYDYANIHLLSLDSYGKDSNTYLMYDTLGPQVRWIKQDLAANTQQWTIAYWHHPPYSMGSHNSDASGDLVAIRNRFIRILERNGVDLILCGHSHCYERSYLMNGHYGNEASFNLATHALSSSTAIYDGSSNSCPYIKNQPKTSGTVYVVAGSAGQLGGQQASWPHTAMVYSNNTVGGALAITVNGNRLDAEWVCNDGVIRDRFTILKDVNKKEIYTIQEGDSVNLSSSWNGSYNWTGGAITKSVKVAPPGIDTDTLIVTDHLNCLRDSFIITKSQQLPIELISFTASKTLANQVLLNWSTATEYRNAYFSVEWSLDGINFSSIGVVQGNGTTNLQHNYRLLHLYPENGNNYYRLKQVNEDSSFLYSTIIPVFINPSLSLPVKDNFLAVFPNPSSTGIFNLDYYATNNKTVLIKIYDLLGILAYSDDWNVFSGITHYSLNLKYLPKGTYMLYVDSEVVKIQN